MSPNLDWLPAPLTEGYDDRYIDGFNACLEEVTRRLITDPSYVPPKVEQAEEDDRRPIVFRERGLVDLDCLLGLPAARRLKGVLEVYDQREIPILSLLSCGLTPKEIASLFQYSTKGSLPVMKNLGEWAERLTHHLIDERDFDRDPPIVTQCKVSSRKAADLARFNAAALASSTDIKSASGNLLLVFHYVEEALKVRQPYVSDGTAAVSDFRKRVTEVAIEQIKRWTREYNFSAGG